MLANRNGRSGLSRRMAHIRQKFSEVAETRDGRFFLLALLVCLTMLPLYFFCLHLPLRQAAQTYAVKAEQARGGMAEVMNFKNVHRDMEAYQKELAEQTRAARRPCPQSLCRANFCRTCSRKP